MPAIAFVNPPRRNAFFSEMAAALCDELTRLGVEANPDGGSVAALEDGVVPVLFPPHELISQIEDRAQLPSAKQLSRSILICAEQPRSGFFEANARLAGLPVGAVFDINRRAVQAYRYLGLEVEHLPMGYTHRWDNFDPERGRPIDVAFLGCYTPRRAHHLARLGRVLAARRTELVISDNSHPNEASGRDFLAGSDKLELLASSQVLLNLHRSEGRYFEWARVLEAIHCGAVVVSEWSTDFEPLVPGEHFLSARPESIQDVLEEALEDEELRARIRVSAYEAIKQRMPLRGSAERLAEAAERIEAQTRRLRIPRPRRRIKRAGSVAANPNIRQLLGHYRDRAPASFEARRREARVEKADRIAAIESRRAEALSANGGPREPERVVTTAAWRQRETPKVSVVVPVYDHAAHVISALTSVDRSRYGDFELIAVDDGSSDESLEAMTQWIVDRGHRFPALVLRHPVNLGLPAARNAGIAAARGELLLFLDADNELYPTCLARLVEALDTDPGASFAYGMLETFDKEASRTVIGHWDWDPARLAEENYIDALAMVRAEVLRETGSFSTDPRLYGWEDYELWCRLAARGHRAAHVRAIVGRYRVGEGSMISLTNISTDEVEELLAELHPNVFAAVGNG